MKHRYYSEVDGSQYLVVVDDGPEGLRVGMVEMGQPEPEQLEPVDFSFVQAPGSYSLLVGGQSVLVRLTPDGEEKGTWHAALRRHQAEVRVQTERDYRLSKVGGPKHQAEGELMVKAPMPGLVKQVAVKPGDSVSRGQRLLVLEAMKMENDILAPRDGVVKAVRVQGGDAVENGRPLVVLE